MSTPWRLVIHGAVDGALNMAIDRAIQICREDGSAPPTVRLYQWARPTVTLGRFQPASDVDYEQCARLGVDVVRRFTGGRGVLHDDELTYSVIASTDDGIPRGTTASYQMLSSCLVQTYRELGVDAQMAPGGRGRTGSAACYMHSTRADLSQGTSKLAGSAQVWMGSTVMQHGSLTLSRDFEREMQVFRLTSEQVKKYASTTATIEDFVPERVSLDSMVAAGINGFEHVLAARLIPGDLTLQEASLVQELLPSIVVETLSNQPRATSTSTSTSDG